MSQREPRLPGPDHPIDIVAEPRRVRVLWGSHVIADTTHALKLTEASYPSVFYVPRADADMNRYAKTARSSHCPYKGDASYYSLVDGDTRAENVVWSYETPYPAMAPIAGHLAFYADKVKIEVE